MAVPGETIGEVRPVQQMPVGSAHERGAAIGRIDVFHKAFVEVLGVGTEAAVATTVAMATEASIEPRTPQVFRADRAHIRVAQGTPLV